MASLLFLSALQMIGISSCNKRAVNTTVNEDFLKLMIPIFSINSNGNYIYIGVEVWAQQVRFFYFFKKSRLSRLLSNRFS